MADYKPVVLVDGEFEVLQAGNTLIEPLNLSPYVFDYFLINDELTTINAGEAVYISGSPARMKRAKADDINTANVVGILIQTTPSLQTGVVRSFGVIAIPTIGAAGLIIYLSPTTAGAITTTAPTTSNQFIVRLGISGSTTDFWINIQPPILLA